MQSDEPLKVKETAVGALVTAELISVLGTRIAAPGRRRFSKDTALA